MHVLYRDASAHETQQPSMQKELHSNPKLLHQQIEVVDFGHKERLYPLTVLFQVSESLQVYHAQLPLFHHLDQGPEGSFWVFDVVQQHSSYHVEALYIPQLYVVNTVSSQNVSKHPPKGSVSRKSRALGVSPWQVLLDLDIVGRGWRQLEQRFKHFPILAADVPRPGLPPGAFRPAEASLVAELVGADSAHEAQPGPVEDGFDFTFGDALQHDTLLFSGGGADIDQGGSVGVGILEVGHHFGVHLGLGFELVDAGGLGTGRETTAVEGGGVFLWLLSGPGRGGGVSVCVVEGRERLGLPIRHIFLIILQATSTSMQPTYSLQFVLAGEQTRHLQLNLLEDDFISNNF